MKQKTRVTLTIVSAMGIFMSGMIAGNIVGYTSFFMLIPYAIFYILLVQVRDSKID